MTVTKALRTTIKNIKPSAELGKAYSDTRTPNPGVKAVGVKFVGLFLSPAECDQLTQQMEESGFKHHYTRVNTGSFKEKAAGTRFCYSVK